MTRILILGAGTAGTIMANRLRRLYAAEVRDKRTSITVVDQDDEHVYQPGLLFIPFGGYSPDQVVRPRREQLHSGVTYVRQTIVRVETSESAVYLGDDSRLPYDVLIIATGARVVPTETEGLTGPGWRETTFDFYTLDGANALARKLADWPGGQLVVDIVEMPIKCPVAPLEFAFLADAFFTKRGIRENVRITYVTPLDSAFTKPACATALSHLLTDKGIELVTEFNAGRVDGEKGTL